MAREAVYIRIILDEMGHKQPSTPIQTDNAMAEGVINSKVQPKRTKQWICDSTGYEIENAKNNSVFIGGQANKTMPTTGRNTTRQNITAMSDENS